MDFNAPIPGQSLTTPPKNFAWERPPEIVDPEEAIQMHLTRLSNPKILESALLVLEDEDMDIQTLVKGIMRGAVANGIHSIDVGILVAPVVHEYIKQAAKAVGIEAEDGFEDKKGDALKKQYAIESKAKRMMAKMGAKPKEVAKEVDMEAAAEEMPKEAPVAPKGLMARGDM
jgi:hypothetical protein